MASHTKRCIYNDTKAYIPYHAHFISKVKSNDRVNDDYTRTETISEMYAKWSYAKLLHILLLQNISSKHFEAHT